MCTNVCLYIDEGIVAMKYSEIYKALKNEGLSWTAVGEAIGCTPQHVMNVCSRRVESPKVAKSVSLLIGRDVSDVFSDIPRYQEKDKDEARALKVSDARARLVEAGLAVA